MNIGYLHPKQFTSNYWILKLNKNDSYESLKIINLKISVMLVVYSVRVLNHSVEDKKVLQTFMPTVKKQVWDWYFCD